MTIMGARGSKLKKHSVDFGPHRREPMSVIENSGADPDAPLVLGRDALEVAMAWAVIGIFLIIFFAIVHYMALILIPVTLAVVVGLILGLVADKLGRAGVPRFGIALILSSLVFLVLFLIANALAEPDAE